jgi:hypothetical protein
MQRKRPLQRKTGASGRVVMFSGGAGSWAAAKREAQQHGLAGLTLLFTDTLIEDADLYRFLVESAANVFRVGGRLDGVIQVAANVPPSTREAMPARRAHLARLRALVAPIMPGLVWLADGRTPWEVFRDERYLGNTRADPCSRVLKRELGDRWMSAHAPDAVRVFGIDWTEVHRFERLAARLGADRVRAPLCEAPYLDKPDVLAWLAREGIAAPRLYGLGFAHNNCGGGCVKAGIGHFAHLYRVLPEVFAEWEREEQALRDHLGKDVAMLRDRSGGAPTPLPLTQLRRRLEAGHAPDLFDIGGCGCFIDNDNPRSEAA